MLSFFFVGGFVLSPVRSIYPSWRFNPEPRLRRDPFFVGGHVTFFVGATWIPHERSSKKIWCVNQPPIFSHNGGLQHATTKIILGRVRGMLNFTSHCIALLFRTASYCRSPITSRRLTYIWKSHATPCDRNII